MPTQEFYWPEGENWLSLEDRAFGDTRIVAQICRGVDARYFAMMGEHIDWHAEHPDLVGPYTLSNPTGTAYEDMEWGPTDEAVICQDHWSRHTPLCWCLGWMHLLQSANGIRSYGGLRWAWDDTAIAGVQRYEPPSEFLSLGDWLRLTKTARWYRIVEVIRGVIDDLHTQFSTEFHLRTTSAESDCYELDPAQREYFPAPTFGRFLGEQEYTALVYQSDHQSGNQVLYDGENKAWTMAYNDDFGRRLFTVYYVHQRPPQYDGATPPHEILANNAELLWNWYTNGLGSIVFSDSFDPSDVFKRAYRPFYGRTPPYISVESAADDNPFDEHGYGDCTLRYPLSGAGYDPPLRRWTSNPGGGVEWKQGKVLLSPPMNYILSMSGCSRSERVMELSGSDGQFTVECSLTMQTNRADNGRQVRFDIVAPSVSATYTLSGTETRIETFSVAYNSAPVGITVTVTDLMAEQVHVASGGSVETDLMPWMSFIDEILDVTVISGDGIESRPMSDPREHEFVISGGNGIEDGDARAFLQVVSWE